ncbi:hypothetical protein, partial [Mycobacterium marinum]|uniref:hypothetical protein n=1 Tax=Mycobacterium marinum TaxID=1781 RepID=UPI0035690E8F
ATTAGSTSATIAAIIAIRASTGGRRALGAFASGRTVTTNPAGTAGPARPLATVGIAGRQRVTAGTTVTAGAAG